MAITFAYDVRKKMYNISKCSARKSASDFDGLWPVCKFLESSNSKRKKSYAQISVFFEFLLNLVKLLIQEVLLLLNNYSRILVLLNNYFSFFEFWSNLVKLWSNNGQTTY